MSKKNHITIPIVDIKMESKKKSKCPMCNKKLCLTDIICKCGKKFCMLHRQPESHNCTFDIAGEKNSILCQNSIRLECSKIECKI